MQYFYLAHSVSSLVCLKNLVKAKLAPELVICHKDYQRKELSKDFFIPLKKYCALKKIKLVQSDNLPDIKDKIKNFEVGVCVGYMNILRKDFFEIPKHGIFNLHCGKLPNYRGRAPISRTIMNGDTNLVMTLHKMDEGVDSGDIAIERNIKITLKDDVNTLYKKFSENSYKTILDLLAKLEKNKLNLLKQKIDNTKANTKLSEAECRINWDRPQREVFNKIRALKFPYPGAFTVVNNEKYFFLNSTMGKIIRNGKAGLINRVDSNGISVNTKDFILKISDIYKDNKKVKVKSEFKTGEQFI